MTTQKRFSRAKLVATGAAVAFAAGLSFAHAQQGEMDHSKMDHGDATKGWADPGKAEKAGPGAGQGHDMSGMSGMSHGGMNHGGMGHGGMGHGGMNHGGMGGMSGMGGMGGGMMNKMLCGFTDHLDGRLAYLKADLKLTDQQTAAWESFADGWRAAARKAKDKCAAAQDHSTHHQGALGHLTMMETHMVDHLEVVRAQKAALEPLMKALTEDQQKAANEALTSVLKVGMQMGGMGGMNHGGGMGGMDHGGMDHGKMDHGDMQH